jgi:hypothetical protein
VLFVEPDSIYKTLPGCDCYDTDRAALDKRDECIVYDCEKLSRKVKALEWLLRQDDTVKCFFCRRKACCDFNKCEFELQETKIEEILGDGE